MLKKGTRQAIGLAGDVVGDVFRGRNIRNSLIQHGKQRAKNLGREALSEGMQSVKGLFGNAGSSTSRKRKNLSKPTRQRQKKKRRTAKALF